MNKDALRQKLLETMPPIFSRQQVKDLTGGMIDGRTVANMDSQGRGPGKVALGPVKVGYVREAFIDWFLDRLSFQDQAGGDQ
ncbi:MAG: hypothetical protein GX043_12540 [Desulfovibrionales bacterium]|nr:hypothetical protein [Desulfovibrionales bacterium]